MARRRFFVPEVRRGTAELTGTDAEHLVRVLRVEAGQLFEISDNQRAYLAEIETARKSAVVFRVREELPESAPKVRIALCPALFKFDRFELMIEKATELGVTSIHPFAAIRSDCGLLQASKKRAERWHRIALEASQQSRRLHLPEIATTAPSLKALAIVAPVKLLLDEDAAAPPILRRLPATDVALLLGPEGGWTAEEREQAVAGGWLPCSLGSTILRAETAAAAALAIVQAAAL